MDQVLTASYKSLRRAMMDDYEKETALWQSKSVSNDAELAEALNGHSITFAYHSGRLENESITYHDTPKVFEYDGITSHTGDLWILFEIRNAKEVYKLFLLAYGDRQPMDEELIKEFQEKLTKNAYDTRCCQRRWRNYFRSFWKFRIIKR